MSDSSIFLLYHIEDYGYKEFSGKISRVNDSVFNVKVHLDFAQIICKAAYDLKMYVTIDSSMQKSIQNITLVYSNSEKSKFPINNQEQLEIPLNNKLNRSDPKKNFFYATVNHKNPIDNSEIRTQFKNKDSYCVTIHQGNTESFQFIIKNNKVRKIGKGSVDNFILTKVTK